MKIKRRKLPSNHYDDTLYLWTWFFDDDDESRLRTNEHVSKSDTRNLVFEIYSGLPNEDEFSYSWFEDISYCISLVFIQEQDESWRAMLQAKGRIPVKKEKQLVGYMQFVNNTTMAIASTDGGQCFFEGKIFTFSYCII